MIDFRKELNAEQCAAATAGDGPMLVLAAAGTGKTRTLVHRVAYLIENGVPAGRILLLTFTLEEWLNSFLEILCSLYLLYLAILYQSRGNLSRVLHLSVEIEDISQSLLVVIIHDIRSSSSGTLVHPHIERRIKAEREASCLIIKVM